MKKIIHAFAVISAGVTALLLGACAHLPESSVPGVGAGFDGTDELEPIPFSDVIMEVRRQLQNSYAHVPYFKKHFPTNRSAMGLNPREGSASLSGTTQIVGTNSGNLLAVIPFSGYAGSVFSPNVGISRSATSIQTTQLDFSVIPRDPSDPKKSIDWTAYNVTGPDDESPEEVEARRVRIAGVTKPLPEPSPGVIERIVVASFSQIAMTPNPSTATGFTNARTTVRELIISLSFSVTRTSDRGLGVKLIPSAPDLDELSSAPLLGSKAERVGTYKLDLTIPLVTAATSDPKRIIYGAVSAGGLLLKDAPYTASLWNKLKGTADKNGASFLDSLDSTPVLLIDNDPEFD